ncbi:glycosyltransferase [Ancylobacter dichloromethanicus]
MKPEISVNRSVSVQPRISVVMATYNGERFLPAQLESLERQSFAPFELVVSDDDLSDGTDEIIARFAERAPFPVRVHKNRPGLGFRDNFLRAAAMATGGWIAFCDQDDVWRADKLERCAAFTALPDVTQIAHQANLIGPDGETVGVFDQGIRQSGIKPPLAYDVWATFWGFSMVVRHDVLRAVPVERRYVDYIDPRHRIAHDRWAFFLAQTLGCTAEIAEPLVDYRQHGANLFGAGRGRRSGPTESRDGAIEKNRPYIAATRQMLDIVRSLPATTEAQFPAFDRARAEAVYLHALCQVEARDRIYGGKAVASAMLCLRGLSAGLYRNAQNDTTRWRSFLKDLSLSLRN